MDSKIFTWLIVYGVGVLLMLLVFTNIGELALDALHKKRKDAKDKARRSKALDGPK